MCGQVTDEMVEMSARAVYIAAGGDETVFPWPCRGADHYRSLARAALTAAPSKKQASQTPHEEAA